MRGRHGAGVRWPEVPIAPLIFSLAIERCAGLVETQTIMLTQILNGVAMPTTAAAPVSGTLRIGPDAETVSPATKRTRPGVLTSMCGSYTP